MAENKTKPTKVNVKDFLDKVEPAQRREDAFEVLRMMEKTSGEPATMWGPSIIGFGTYRYKYTSGREGDICQIGFSPRRQSLVLYLSDQFEGKDELLKKLGKYKISTACLYINKLSDVNKDILEEMIKRSYKWTKNRRES